MTETPTKPNTAQRRRSPVGVILKFIIPLVISVGLCWALFRNDNLADMVEIIRANCDFRWIGLMLFMSFMSCVFRALRWGIQLEGVGVKASFRSLLYSIFGTYAVNLVFPRLGEVWRSGFIAHREDAPFGTVVGTMLADRFADLLTGILFTFATLLIGHEAIEAFIKRYPDSYRQMAHIATSPWTWLVVVALVMAAVWFFKRRSSNGLVNKIKEFCRQLWSGFAAILKIKRKGLWLLWTALLWGCYFGQMVVAFQALPFTREIYASDGLTVVLVCFTLGTIAMGIPSNGGIGPYQIAVIFGLMLYCPVGLDEAAKKAFELDSKAFANLILTVNTCLTIVLGLWTFAAIALRAGSAKNVNGRAVNR